MPSRSPAQARLMRAVAHSPAFAKKVKIPQSVGKEFAAADKATGKFKRKDPPMKKPMMKSSAMSGSDGMSPRKAMAMGKSPSGAESVKSYASEHGGTGSHPDYRGSTGAKGEMQDGNRGAPPAMNTMKGQLPGQGKANHGPTNPGGHGANWNRSGMA